jgi:hypothetical protein
VLNDVSKSRWKKIGNKEFKHKREFTKTNSKERITNNNPKIAFMLSTI